MEDHGKIQDSTGTCAECITNCIRFPFSVRDKYGPDTELSEESSSSEEEDETAQVSCTLNMQIPMWYVCRLLQGYLLVFIIYWYVMCTFFYYSKVDKCFWR